MIAASVDVEGALLLLKAAFLVLLYLFIWRIVRTASRDLRLPQESFVLGPQQAAAAGLRPEPQPQPQMGRLVVIRSSAIDENTEFELDSTGISIGRGGPNDVRLDARRLRFREPRPRRAAARRRLDRRRGIDQRHVRQRRPAEPGAQACRGDLVRVGDTDLRFET